MLPVGSLDDLVSKVRYSIGSGSRPIAFMIGSGLTRGTVADVDLLVQSMRSALQNEADYQRFDIAVGSKAGGERYQRASEFLILNRDQKLLNRVIRLAVLGSCKSLSLPEARTLVENEAELRRLEQEANWALDPGVAALGELLTILPSDVRGPIITTNFDPLIEVAVRKAGGKPAAQFIDTDGKIVRGDDTGVIDVIHVHGYWRRGDTLHTVHQLSRERPLLDGSLRERLRGHLVVVLGYSGWSDAFSKSLLGSAKQHEFNGMDVAWCSYAMLTEAQLASGLFAELAEGNSATFYQGIDSNLALPTLLQSYKQSLPGGATPSFSALRGWTLLDERFLSLRTPNPPNRNDRLNFFNGVQPDWATALDPSVPRLALAGNLTEALNRCQTRAIDKMIVAAVGPMGEGKSIALRQAAISIARSHPELTVFWREPGTTLAVDDILRLPHRPDGGIVLVSDDGDLLVGDLAKLAGRCRSEARSDISVLLVAQDRDWRNRNGFNRLRRDAEVIGVGGLSLTDAQAIVTAWEELGADGLGELASVDSDARAKRLVDLAGDPAGPPSESLIGAMLSVRFGSGLKDRVADLLNRLNNFGAVGTGSLVSAFLMIAISHATFRAGSSPLSVRVLAEALNLPTSAVEYVVLDPLGKEAAVTAHAGDVWTRHESVARTALEVSRERDAEELPRILTGLVQTAVKLAPSNGRLDDDLYSVAYLSRYLERESEAVAAAEAAVDAAPKRMSYRTSLIATLRNFRRYDEALTVAAAAWRTQTEVNDRESIVGFLGEWATAAGQAGMPSLNVLLDALALQAIGTLRDTDKEIIRALLGMGVGLTNLHKQNKDRIWVDALGGVVGLVTDLEPAGKHTDFLRRHTAYFTKFGSKDPRLTPEEAIQRAVDKLQDSPPDELRGYLSAQKISLQHVSGQSEAR